MSDAPVLNSDDAAKSKITKLPNSEENSKRKNQKIKSSKTSNEWITTIIFLTKNRNFQIPLY